MLYGVSLAKTEARPNILFIFLDDYGWRDNGFMGSDFYETPHIDKLASEGMVFTDAYSGAANCAPARACLLSGQYSPRHEIYNVGTGPRGKAEHRRLKYIPGVATLPRSTKTWADSLRGVGYATASIGKWHLSDNPCDYGFDLNIGGSHSGSPPKGYFPPHPKVAGLADAPANEYLTDRLNEEAVRWITDQKAKPWLLYLSHFAVHTPLQAKKSDEAYFAAKPAGKLHNHVTMAAMIKSVDDGVGELVATLETLGLREQTAIFFFSDNGGYGPATSMAPLRGYKGTYYEGGIREPFFVTWPGKIKAGTKNATPIIGTDLFPTFCAIAGAALPDQPLDGVSLLPMLTGETETLDREAIFWHFPAYLQSYQRSDEQRDPLFRSRPVGVVRAGDWKLHENFEDGELELYNLKKDIGESTNLADTNPAKRDELHQLLKKWRSETKAPVPTEPNPTYNAEAEAAAIAAAVGTGKAGAKTKRK